MVLSLPWYSLTPSLTGWGFCIRQKNIGFEDRVTEEHRGIVTEVLLFNDISFGDRVTN